METPTGPLGRDDAGVHLDDVGSAQGIDQCGMPEQTIEQGSRLDWGVRTQDPDADTDPSTGVRERPSVAAGCHFATDEQHRLFGVERGRAKVVLDSYAMAMERAAETNVGAQDPGRAAGIHGDGSTHDGVTAGAVAEANADYTTALEQRRGGRTAKADSGASARRRGCQELVNAMNVEYACRRSIESPASFAPRSEKPHRVDRVGQTRGDAERRNITQPGCAARTDRAPDGRITLYQQRVLAGRPATNHQYVHSRDGLVRRDSALPNPFGSAEVGIRCTSRPHGRSGPAA